MIYLLNEGHNTRFASGVLGFFAICDSVITLVGVLHAKERAIWKGNQGDSLTAEFGKT
jgi:hypothetical protein